MNRVGSHRHVVAAHDHAAWKSMSDSRVRKVLRSGRSYAGTRVLLDFADFAGSPANVANLVTGLAWGVPITLTARARNERAFTSISFAAPTPPLRNCDVCMGLWIAKRLLTDLGINRPAPEHLKAALVGGVVIVDAGRIGSRALKLAGVLTLRSQGMSWTAVAASQGVTLGNW